MSLGLDADDDALFRDEHELVGPADDLHAGERALLRRDLDGLHALAAAVVLRIVLDGVRLP